jgi:O-antigen/teichoic acid export membrane protein
MGDAGPRAGAGGPQASSWEAGAGTPSGGADLLRDGVLWTLAGSASKRLGAFLATWILARHLGREGVGAYALLVSLSLLAAWAQPAVSAALVKLVADREGSGGAGLAAARAQAGLGLGGALLAAGAAALVAGRDLLAGPVYGEPLVALLAPWAAAGLLASGAADLLGAVFQGLKLFRIANVVGAAAALLGPAAALLLVPRLGLRGIFLALALAGAAAAAVSAGLLLHRARRLGLRLRRLPDAAAVGEVARFAAPVLLSGLAGPAAIWIAHTILVLARGLADLGAFNVAHALAAIIPFLAASVGTVLVPLVAGDAASGGGGAAEMTRRALRLVLLAGLPAALVLAVYGRPILVLLYGPAFEAAAPVLGVLSAAGLLVAAAHVLGALLMGKGAVWRGLAVNALWMVVFLVLSLVLVPGLGAAGLAWAFAGSYAVHCAVLIGVSRRLWGLALEGSAPLLALVAGSFLAAAGLGTWAPPPAVPAAGAALLAAVAAAEYGILTAEERRFLLGRPRGAAAGAA